MISGNSGDWHSVGYNMMFLIREDDGRWDWIHTTNPDLDGDGRRDGPYEPGRLDAAVIADANTDWQVASGGCGTWQKPYYANHVDTIKACVAPPDSDVLYGDGHVEMVYKLQHYAFRALARGTYAY